MNSKFLTLQLGYASCSIYFNFLVHLFLTCDQAFLFIRRSAKVKQRESGGRQRREKRTPDTITLHDSSRAPLVCLESRVAFLSCSSEKRTPDRRLLYFPLNHLRQSLITTNNIESFYLRTVRITRVVRKSRLITRRVHFESWRFGKTREIV